MPSNRKLKNSRKQKYEFFFSHGCMGNKTQRHKKDKLEYKKKITKQKTATQQRFKRSYYTFSYFCFVLFYVAVVVAAQLRKFVYKVYYVCCKSFRNSFANRIFTIYHTLRDQKCIVSSKRDGYIRSDTNPIR